jgi:hypothetical protein
MVDFGMSRENIPSRGKAETPHKVETESIELHPDGEKRFRAAVRAAAKSGPKHRQSRQD